MEEDVELGPMGGVVLALVDTEELDLVDTEDMVVLDHVDMEVSGHVDMEAVEVSALAVMVAVEATEEVMEVVDTAASEDVAMAAAEAADMEVVANTMLHTAEIHAIIGTIKLALVLRSNKASKKTSVLKTQISTKESMMSA